MSPLATFSKEVGIMAAITRGRGDTHESTMAVLMPDAAQGDRPDDDIVVLCTDADGTAGDLWGFPMRLLLSHQEAIRLCAELAKRLAIAADYAEESSRKR
jgi:hypothetical protein